MKNFKFYTLMGIFVGLSFSGCSQDATNPAVVDTTVYEDCCGNSPVEFKNGGVYVYVPNVFTPNNDGVNDYFFPIVDGNVEEVVNYTILSQKDDSLIFFRPTVYYKDLPNSVWNGLRQDGTTYIGAFKYSMEVVTKSAALLKITGNACRIQCGQEAAVFRSKQGCFFPSQIDTSGKLDPLLPTLEQGCFK